MIEPTPDEIFLWRSRLNDDDFRKLLKRFQDKIYEICEEYRKKVGIRYIRVVLPRHEIKTLNSVIDKIARQRQNKSTYNLKDINDLIGVKILCPYLSSAEEIAKWLSTQTKHFTLKPKNLKNAWVSYDTGYKGYHFTTVPNIRQYPEFSVTWRDIKCEIQVKTMCQEAWDAQTHEITYKREEFTDPNLLEHMKQLSQILTAIDEQGEIIKNQIKRKEQIDQERKGAAAIDYFAHSSKLIQELSNKYKLNIKCCDPRKLTPRALDGLNIAIGRYLGEKKITQELCYLAALLAVCRKTFEQEDMAIEIARKFVEENPTDPVAEDTRASIFWALNRFDNAVMCGESALKKAMNNKSEQLDAIKSNLCYWVADAVVAGKKVKATLRQKVLKLGNELKADYPKEAGYLDTVGFLQIALGDASGVEQGLSLVRDACEFTEKSGNQDTIVLAKKFRSRHERLAFLRLAELHQ